MSFNTNDLNDSVKVISDVVYNNDKITTYKYNNVKMTTSIYTLNKCNITDYYKQHTQSNIIWNEHIFSLDKNTFIKDNTNIYVCSALGSEVDTSIYYINNNLDMTINNNYIYNDNINVFIRNALLYSYYIPSRYTIREKNITFTNYIGDNVFLITDSSQNYTYTYIYIYGNINNNISTLNYGYIDSSVNPYNIYPITPSNSLHKFINVPTNFPNKPNTTYINSLNSLANYSEKYYNNNIKSFGISAVCVLSTFIVFVDTSRNLYSINMPITTIFTDNTSVPTKLIPKTKYVNVDKMYKCNTFLIYETNENPKNPTINFLGYNVDKDLYNTLTKDQYLLGAFPIGNNSAYFALNTFDKQFDSLAKSIFYSAEDKISFFRNSLLNNSFNELNKQNIIYNGSVKTLFDDNFIDIQNKYHLIPYKIDYNYPFTNIINNITNKINTNGSYIYISQGINSRLIIYLFIDSILSNIHLFVFTIYPQNTAQFNLNSCKIKVNDKTVDLNYPIKNSPLSNEAYNYYNNVLLNSKPVNNTLLSVYNKTIYTFKYNLTDIDIDIDNISECDITLNMSNVIGNNNSLSNIETSNIHIILSNIKNIILPVINIKSISSSVVKLNTFKTSINYIIDLSSTNLITLSGYLDIIYDIPVNNNISPLNINRLVFDTSSIVNNKINISINTDSKFHLLSLLSINIYINDVLNSFKLFPNDIIYVMTDSANMIMYTNQLYSSYNLSFEIDKNNEIVSYMPDVYINMNNQNNKLNVKLNNNYQLISPNITSNIIKYVLSDLSYNFNYILSNVSTSFTNLIVNSNTNILTNGSIHYNINGIRDDNGIYDTSTSILLNLNTRSLHNSIIIPYEFTNNLDLSNYSNYDIVNDDINEVCYLTLKNTNNYITDIVGKFIRDKITNEIIYKIIKYKLYKGNTLDYITTSLYYNLNTNEIYSKSKININTYTYTGIDLIITDNSNVYIKDNNNYLYRCDIILDTQNGYIDTVSQYNDIIGIYNDNISYRVDNMNDWSPKGVVLSKMTQKIYNLFPKIANIYDISSSIILDKTINNQFYDLITKVYPNYYITNDKKFILSDTFDIVYEKIKTNSLTYYTDKSDILNAENMLFNIVENNNIVGHFTIYTDNQNNLREGLILNISDFSIYGYSELYIYNIFESNLLSLRDIDSNEQYYVGILEIQRDSQSFIITLNIEENGLPLDKYYTLTNIYDIYTYGQVVTFENNKYYLNNNNLYSINNNTVSTTPSGFLTNYYFRLINNIASQITEQQFLINIVYQPDTYILSDNSQKTLYKTVDNSNATFYMTVHPNKNLTIEFIKLNNSIYSFRRNRS